MEEEEEGGGGRVGVENWVPPSLYRPCYRNFADIQGFLINVCFSPSSADFPSQQWAKCALRRVIL
jgi:hypothetical protein